MSHSITSRKYVPFYYWSKICPLYLVVEKTSVEKVSVEKMSVEKMPRCHCMHWSMLTLCVFMEVFHGVYYDLYAVPPMSSVIS